MFAHAIAVAARLIAAPRRAGRRAGHTQPDPRLEALEADGAPRLEDRAGARRREGNRAPAAARPGELGARRAGLPREVARLLELLGVESISAASSAWFRSMSRPSSCQAPLSIARAPLLASASMPSRLRSTTDGRRASSRAT